MLTGITICNFRGIRDASVDGFSRVNIVVGDNGSGKTTLLEAIYLAMSSSALQATELQRLRGGTLVGPTTSKPVLWRLQDLVTEGAAEISVETRGDSAFARKLHVQSATGESILPQEENVEEEHILSSSYDVVAPLRFIWTDSVGKSAESQLSLRNDRMASGWGELTRIGMTIVPPFSPGVGESARIFSMLSRMGDVEGYFKAMHEQFRELEAIVILDDGGRPALHARMKGQKHQRPIESLSGGVARLSSILLSIALPSILIVGVDEIENGVHHARLPLLWTQLHAFANRFNKQVFATTHSLECLDAAADVMAKFPGDFALIRTAQTERGIQIGLLDGESGQDLISAGLEVRG